MKIVTNFSELIPVKPGLYNARVVRVVDHISKQGTRCVRVSFQIVGGEFNNRYVSRLFPLEGAGGGYFRKFIRAIIPAYSLGMELDASDLNGKAVKVELAYSSPSTEDGSNFANVTVHPADYIFDQISEGPVSHGG